MFRIIHIMLNSTIMFSLLLLNIIKCKENYNDLRDVLQFVLFIQSSIKHKLKKIVKGKLLQKTYKNDHMPFSTCSVKTTN